MTAQSPISINSYLGNLESILAQSSTLSRGKLFQLVVDAPFTNPLDATRLDLGIVVLLLTNRLRHRIDRVALSRTPMAQGAVLMSAKPFKSIHIPLGHPVNIIAKAIDTGELTQTSDWKTLFVPALTAQQARFNQSGAGIETSIVSRLNIKPGGAMIFSFYQPAHNLGQYHYDFVQSYAQLVSKCLGRLF